MKETSPRYIKDLVDQGKISPGDGAAMFGQRHEVAEVPTEIITPKRQGPTKLQLVGWAVADKTKSTFNSRNSELHYQARRDIEEGFKHIVGIPIYAATGIIDGALEGGVYLVSEVAEDLTYLVARTGTRMRQGWERGKRG